MRGEDRLQQTRGIVGRTVSRHSRARSVAARSSSRRMAGLAVEPNSATEDRLLALTRQTERDLLASGVARLAAAYRAQGLRIARARR